MCRALLVLLLVLTVAPAASGQDRAANLPRDPLARARVLYNQRQFAAAIAFAEQARQMPGRADSADLIVARARLELFRENASTDDLDGARLLLRRLNAQRLGPRERFEFIVGLGESLYFGDAFGAAAEVFEPTLLNRESLSGGERDRVLDWWANALDKDARLRAEIERTAVYERIRERMRTELAADPGSRSAAYWLAAGAWGQGDLPAAWQAALAAWVLAPLGADQGAALRADLDRLVLQGLIPDRARLQARPPEALRLEWDQFKALWERP
jgi:hypothetical protein